MPTVGGGEQHEKRLIDELLVRIMHIDHTLTRLSKKIEKIEKDIERIVDKIEKVLSIV